MEDTLESLTKIKDIIDKRTQDVEDFRKSQHDEIDAKCDGFQAIWDGVKEDLTTKITVLTPIKPIDIVETPTETEQVPINIIK